MRRFIVEAAAACSSSGDEPAKNCLRSRDAVTFGSGRRTPASRTIRMRNEILNGEVQPRGVR
jgi:hypothetical protein